MTTHKLDARVTTKQDKESLSRFYVERGKAFDLKAFCKAQGIDAAAVDKDSAEAVAQAVQALQPGEFLDVGYSTETPDNPA